MLLPHSTKGFRRLVMVLLVGISVWLTIIMIKSGIPCGLLFEKPYGEGSLPALLCPAPSDSSSLR